MLEQVLTAYKISSAAIIQPHGNGLINNTWKVTYLSDDYILQKVNHFIFKEPSIIADNIEAISCYLKKNFPEYLFAAPLKTPEGKSMVCLDESNCFRIFPYVKNSVTLSVAKTADDAYEAARQFGLFTKNLSLFPVNLLKTTLPDFHNLSIRYQQFKQALTEGNESRINETKTYTDFLIQHNHVVSTFEKITCSNECKKRVTHHDTKISNVLFDQEGKGLCVIDLDTVMPGYFISDVGDMMRTYLSPVSEEEKDFSKIEIREDFFSGIVEGYLNEMADELTKEEINHFVYAGFFMIYMQALRFLTDYLYNDRYYTCLSPTQNFIRAKNQIVLLKHLIDKQNVLDKIVKKTAGR